MRTAQVNERMLREAYENNVTLNMELQKFKLQK